MNSKASPIPKNISLILMSYSFLTLFAFLIALFRGEPNLFVCTPLMNLKYVWLRHIVSGLLGFILAFLVVILTRILVRSWSYARLLHQSLRPIALAMGPQATWLMALASSIGEETFFRGALVPGIGILASSALFGIVHQTPGRARWVWAIFAFVMGLLLAFLFKWTGSLIGPLITHALVNAINFRFLIHPNRNK